MLELLFSLHFFSIVLLIIVLSVGIAWVCAIIQKQLLSVSVGEWLAEHVYCPLARVLLLMLMAFLMFPLIVQGESYGNLAELFFDTEFLTSMANILFVSSLLLTFLPLLNHPALAMPLLGCIATGLIFLHQIAIPEDLEMQWFTSGGELLRIVVLMILSYFFTRWSSRRVSAWLDYRFNITRTRLLVQDVHYLILQTPVLLAYGHSLNLQTTS